MLVRWIGLVREILNNPMDISEKSKSNEAFSAILFLIDEFIGERAAKFRKKPYICRKMTRF